MAGLWDRRCSRTQLLWTKWTGENSNLRVPGKSPELRLEFLLASWSKVEIGRWPLGLCEGGTTSPF